MRSRVRATMQALVALFFIFGLSDARLNAQGILKSAGKSAGGTSPSAPSTSPLSYELDAESSFFGTGAANAGSKNVGDITEITSSARIVLSAQVRDTFYSACPTGLGGCAQRCASGMRALQCGCRYVAAD